MSLVIPTYWKAVDGVSAVMRTMVNSTASFASKSEAAFQRADRAVNKYTTILNHAQHELLETFAAAAIAQKGIAAIEYGFDAVKEYDESITKLQTNFRLSDAAMLPFKQQVMDVAKETYKAGAEVSDVFNIIGSKNRDLVNQPSALAEMAKSSITLSEALKTELIPSAEGLTGIMAGFKLTDSAKAIDAIAGASSSGSVQGLALMDALKGISQEAHHANLSLGQTAAMMEYIDKSAQDGGASATAFMRTILKLESLPAARGYKTATGAFDINSAIAGIQKQLAGKSAMVQELILKDMFKITTPKQVLAARALIAPGSLEAIAKYQKNAEMVGRAEEMAAKNSATLAVSIERVKNQFGNALINSKSFNSAMDAMNLALQFVYKHMDAILKVIGYLIGAFIAWKTIMLGITIVTKGIAIAQFIYANALSASAAAQILLNLAMDACPLFLFVTLLALAATTVYEVVKHWDEWGASMTLSMGPMGQIISMLVTIHKHWDLITKAFTGEGMMSGLIQIGRTIQDAIIYPMGQLMQIIAKVTGAKWAQDYAAAFTAIHKNLGEGRAGEDFGNTNAVTPAINSKAVQQNSYFNNMYQSPLQRLGIDINTASGLNASVSNNQNNIPVTTTSTHGKVGE